MNVQVSMTIQSGIAKITMSQLYRPKSIHVVVLDMVIVNMQGHTNTIKSEKNTG